MTIGYFYLGEIIGMSGGGGGYCTIKVQHELR